MGLPSDNETFGNLLKESISQEGNLDELRYWLVGRWSRLPLASKPGTTFAYSNMGYTVVGAMIERVSGKTWDEAIFEQIFKPLNLETAGLGPQASLGQIDAPMGHALVQGKVKAFLAGPNGDNPPIIVRPGSPICRSWTSPAGPAGTPARESGHRAGQAGILRKLQTPVITMPEKKEAAPARPLTAVMPWGGRIHRPLGARSAVVSSRLERHEPGQIWIDRTRDLAIVAATNISCRKADQASWP